MNNDRKRIERLVNDWTDLDPYDDDAIVVDVMVENIDLVRNIMAETMKRIGEAIQP
jgi:hypothetical protein